MFSGLVVMKPSNPLGVTRNGQIFCAWLTEMSQAKQFLANELVRHMHLALQREKRSQNMYKKLYNQDAIDVPMYIGSEV